MDGLDSHHVLKEINQQTSYKSDISGTNILYYTLAIQPPLSYISTHTYIYNIYIVGGVI